MYTIRITFPLFNTSEPVKVTTSSYSQVDYAESIAKSIAAQYKVKCDLLQAGDLLKSFDFRPDQLKPGTVFDNAQEQKPEK